jgi:hypothetical protein
MSRSAAHLPAGGLRRAARYVRFALFTKAGERPIFALDTARNKMAQFLKISLRRWLEYLAAILIGNAIYFLSLSPHLPADLRHQTYHIDLGMAVDFLICVALYGLIRLGERLSR